MTRWRILRFIESVCDHRTAPSFPVDDASWPKLFNHSTTSTTNVSQWTWSMRRQVCFLSSFTLFPNVNVFCAVQPERVRTCKPAQYFPCRGLEEGEMTKCCIYWPLVCLHAHHMHGLRKQHVNRSLQHTSDGFWMIVFSPPSLVIHTRMKHHSLSARSHCFSWAAHVGKKWSCRKPP